MIINAVDNSMLAYNTIVPATTGDGQVAPREEPAIAPQPSDTPDESADVATNDGPKVKGVIRNLMNGHFKGVADVRLRINFHDEIAAMEQAEAERVAGEGVSDIMQYVNSELDALVQSGEVSEQAATAISEVQSVFNSPSEVNNSTANLRAGFDELVTSLNFIFEPETETGTEEAVESPELVTNPEAVTLKADVVIEDEIAAPVEESSFDFEQFITGLVESFDLKLSELESALSNIQVLPELSEPRGKGVAYEKFLAAYNQLNGNAEPEVATETIDTVS